MAEPRIFTYDEMCRMVEAVYSTDSNVWDRLQFIEETGNYYGAIDEELAAIGVEVSTSPSGRVLGYRQKTPLKSYNGSGVISNNSNVQMAEYAGNTHTITTSATATKTATQTGTKTTFEMGAKKVGTGTKVMTAVSEVSWATMAASLGGRLGIMLGQEWYESGVSWAWSKQDWADFLANDADDLDRAVLSFLTGVDPSTGETTEYMDELALAQMYMTLRQMGVYDLADYESTYDAPASQTDYRFDIYPQPLLSMQTQWMTAVMPNMPNGYFLKADHPVTMCKVRASGNGGGAIVAISKAPFMWGAAWVQNVDTAVIEATTPNNSTQSATINGTSFYYARVNYSAAEYGEGLYPINICNATDYGIGAGTVQDKIATIIYDGDTTEIPHVDGLEKDPNATTYIDPSLVNGQDRDTVLNQLKQNYPELFNDSIYQDVPQKDGTNQRINYVPVPFVKPSTQPKTGTHHQNNPSVDPQTDPQTDLQDMIDLITQLFNPTDLPDTGDGDTPPTVIPTGNASSLWSIYNPTQAQLDSFGSWLWSSNFVDQLKKLFNDPMQAIIGVHKVFAAPSTGATQTIVCGYIDSEVPSKIVTSQYTTVNCGTVHLKEYFGNVFDYSPFTEVSLYLPFIGIVKLDVGDVMRASISIRYHVDVITGACLADVVVNRDGAGGVLYQYSGSAIVTYPISSGSYASAVGGILTIAGGVAATVMTGGAAAPAILGAAAGISHLHSDVQKSGSFTGAAGAMGGKIPYLIISRPQTGMPSSFKHLQGYPVNYYTKLGDCSGHVRVSDVQVKGVNATDTELDMIRDALLQGVEI